MLVRLELPCNLFLRTVLSSIMKVFLLKQEATGFVGRMDHQAVAVTKLGCGSRASASLSVNSSYISLAFTIHRDFGTIILLGPGVNMPEHPFPLHPGLLPGRFWPPCEPLPMRTISP